MGLSRIDLIVVVVYAIGIFGLAQWLSREKAGHKKDTSDYFLASKSLPWWAIGTSLIGGLIVSGLALNELGGGQGMLAGFRTLTQHVPDDLAGLSVLNGGMWIANLSYWGFNEYIIQRALAAKNLGEAQNKHDIRSLYQALDAGCHRAARDCGGVAGPQSGQAGSGLSDNDALPAVGAARPRLLGAGGGYYRLDRVQDQFDRDHFHARSVCQGAQDADPRGGGHRRAGAGGAFGDGRADRRRRRDRDRDHRRQTLDRPIGSGLPVHSEVLRLLHAGHHHHFPGRPVLETGERGGAIAAAIASVVLSYVFRSVTPDILFMNRMPLVFLISLVMAIGASLVRPAGAEANCIRADDVPFGTPASFNIGGIGVILIALYAAWW